MIEEDQPEAALQMSICQHQPPLLGITRAWMIHTIKQPATKQSDTKPYATTRSAAVLSVLSILSPLSGLVMEMMLAWRYGASDTVDAFRTASLILALGNQLFFGYLLPHVVVPLFLEYRAKGLEHEGWRLAFSLALILSLVSLIFILWVWFDPEVLVRLLSPGMEASGQRDAAKLIRCFSLALLSMVWGGVISGILYVYRIFWFSAVAQLLTNMFVVLTIFIADRESGVNALALGTLLGYISMIGMFSYPLVQISRASNIRLSAYLKPCSKDTLQKAFHLLAPLVLTVFIVQWGAIVINRTLSGMSPGTLAEFGYAWKLLALVSLLPASLTTVLFPSFSAAYAHNNLTEFSRLAMRAFRMTLLLTIPLAGALFVERLPLVSLIFGRGLMNMTAINETSQLFGILVIGAPAGVLSTILSKIAFSMQDTKSSTVVGLISTLAITGIVPYTAKIGGADAVAWASTLIAWTVALVMLGYLIFCHQLMPIWEVLWHFILVMELCIGVGLSVMTIRFLFELSTQFTSSFALLEMIIAASIFLIMSYLLSRVLKIHEAFEIWHYIKWQILQMPYIKKLKKNTDCKDQG